ncbi:hypothetical protein ACFQ1I_30250 [Kitasatospora arboriphila]
MEPGAPATGSPARGRRRLLQLLLAMLLVALVVGGAVPYVSGAGRAYLSYLVLAERQDADGASLAAAEARAAADGSSRTTPRSARCSPTPPAASPSGCANGPA